MAASDSLRFTIIGEDRASDAFSRVGRATEAMSGKFGDAAAKSAFLDDALRRQSETARRSTDATLALAKSDEILAEVEGRLRDGALEAEFALKKETEAKKKSGDAAVTAAAKNKTFADSLSKIAGNAQKGGGPAWLGPALALAPLATSFGGVAAGAAIGLGGAAVAGAGALAAFGAVAKPVLAQALTAEQQVQTAQDAYTLSVQKTTAQYQIAMGVAKTQAQRNAAYAAEQKGFAADRLAETQAITKAYIEMSPQQIALSRQLGNMAQAWQNVKAAETPVVAGALQPWLKSVTDLTGKLGPIIGAVSPFIQYLGTQMDRLVNSPAFTKFRDFIAGTGSAVVGAVGNSVIDLVKAFIVILPQFAPLIDKAAAGVLSFGQNVLKWSQSKKASEDITKFMGWFSTNGPAVGGLLKNIGGALKALAPGLGPASTAEINMISQFFALIGKLPPAVAKPLLEVAGVMLTLNKLGVVSVGVKLGGVIGTKFAESALGKALLSGGPLSLVLPVALAVTAIAGLNQIKDKTGGGTLLAPKAADLGFNGRWAHDISHWYTVLNDQVLAIWNLMWNNTVARLTRGLNDMDKLLGGWEHNVAHWFDVARNDTAHIWDVTWNNTIGRAQRGSADANRVLLGWYHNVFHWFDTARHDMAASWDLAWSNTVGRAARGVGDVVHWVATLPGKISGAVGNAGKVLTDWGAGVINGLVKGMSSVVGSVWNFVKSIPSKILNFLGIHSPPQWAIDAGKHIMNGIGIGMSQAQAKAKSATASFQNSVANQVASNFGGVPGTSGNVISWITAALRDTGSPMSWLAPLEVLVSKESGGNPYAINPQQVLGENASGLFQTLPSTFAQFATVPGGIFNPIADAVAGIRYLTATYGSPFNIPGLLSGTYRGYAMGTGSAAPGWAWVGEHGPELMHFHGGEQVVPAHGGGGGNAYVINVNVAPGANPGEAGRLIVNAIRAFEQRSGNRWRK